MKENATAVGKSELVQKTHQSSRPKGSLYLVCWMLVVVHQSHYFVSNRTMSEDEDIASVVAAVTPAETDDPDNRPLQTNFKTKIHEASYMYEVRYF